MSAEVTMTMRHRRQGIILLALAASVMLTCVDAQAAKIGMVCTPSVAPGVTFDLAAKTGYIETPDGNSVFNWSYADQHTSGGRFQEPGPVLCVNQGDHVTVNLHNGLDV